jgi:hypothetical protein
LGDPEWPQRLVYPVIGSARPSPIRRLISGARKTNRHTRTEVSSTRPDSLCCVWWWCVVVCCPPCGNKTDVRDPRFLVPFSASDSRQPGRGPRSTSASSRPMRLWSRRRWYEGKSMLSPSHSIRSEATKSERGLVPGRHLGLENCHGHSVRRPFGHRGKTREPDVKKEYGMV